MELTGEYIDPYEGQLFSISDDELPSASDVEDTWQERVVQMSERYFNPDALRITIKLFRFQCRCILAYNFIRGWYR